MSNFNVSDYMNSPLDMEQKRQRNELMGYQNMLTKQAMEDEQQQRSGYQAAYQNMLAQQAPQQQPQETVQPTDALAKLGYGDFQYQQPPQPQQQMPYQPPQGASYGHIKGAEQANALFQKQQMDYYTHSVAPLIQTFMNGGNNTEKDKLIESVMASNNPMTGMAKYMLSYMSDINFSAPGKIDNIKLTPETKAILSSMAGENQLLKTTIDSMENGTIISAEADRSGGLVKVSSPSPKSTQTRIIKRDMGDGTQHNILVDALTGADINDLGPALSSGSRGNAPLSPDQEKSAQSYAKALREGRLAGIDQVPAFRGMRDRVMHLVESGTESSGENPISYVGDKAGSKAVAGSLAQQEKQRGAMGGFVRNLDKQVARVEKLSNSLSTFDTRLLNVPLRAVRGRIAGSPDQAKYEMYLTEIESEIGKLATGSTGSVKELSEGAQEKWAKIHDKNLSIKDMLELLKETSHAGHLRMESVQEEIKDTESRAQRVSGSGAVPMNVAAPLAVQVKKHLADKKVNVGDTIKARWTDGKLYRLTVGPGGTFSKFEYIKE